MIFHNGYMLCGGGLFSFFVFFGKFKIFYVGLSISRRHADARIIVDDAEFIIIYVTLLDFW